MAVPAREIMAAKPPALGFCMAHIRAFRPDDLDSLYRICLATGDAGADAAHLYRDPELVGHVYAGGYAALSPQTAFVAEDGEGVAGYIIGPADTRAFDAKMDAAMVAGPARALSRCERLFRIAGRAHAPSHPSSAAHAAHGSWKRIPRTCTSIFCRGCRGRGSGGF